MSPRRRFTDFDPDKLVFWFCVAMAAVAYAFVQ